MILQETAIRTLSEGTVLVDYGPMRMLISVFEDGKPLTDLARLGGNLAISILENVSRFLGVVKNKSKEVQTTGKFPDVVQRMIEATQKMEESDLTPLAAVAGASSDVVADFLISQGGSKIIVENGGDIAIRLKEGEAVRIGVKTAIEAKYPSYVLPVDFSLGVGGVATSGLGGRSFTKGIASATTVLASDASLADAAATVIGNFTNVEDAEIKRALAETIYPDTDIAGEWVTVGVGKIAEGKIQEALNNGLAKAYSISQRGLIKGALIAVQDRVAWTISLNPYLRKL